MPDPPAATLDSVASAPAPSRRMIAVHHRLVDAIGNQLQEAIGLADEAPRRGFELRALIHAGATPAVRAALPHARAVLHDPVFGAGATFDARTRDFTAMLHRHVDADVRPDDVVLMTTVTACEMRAAAWWLRELPPERRPVVVLLVHGDRWDRSGASSVPDDADVHVLAREIASLPPTVVTRLVVGASTPPLARELTARLGIPVRPSPLTHAYGAIRRAAAVPRPSQDVPCVGVLGGARTEKGSHLVPGIVAACGRRTRVRFLIQLADEGLAPPAWEALQALDGVEGVHVLRGALSDDAFAAALATCDLLLFPYDLDAYRNRGSGVFADAVVAGKVVLAPRELWLAEAIVTGAAAGLAYPGAVVDPIAAGAAAIAAAVDELPALARRAAACAPGFFADNSLPGFLAWIEAAVPPAAATARESISPVLTSASPGRGTEVR